MMNYHEYTLKNNKITVKFLDLGGTLTHFSTSDDGKNCIIRFKDLDSYIINRGFLGANVGPLAGRTEDARFEVAGQIYHLDQNVPPHHLHGGSLGLNKQLMKVDIISDTHAILTTTTDYTETGYPGSTTITITYKLVDNSFTITYDVIPTKPMPINITNHSYFNLSQEETAKGHDLQVPSNYVVAVSENGSNTDTFIPVSNTVFDLNQFNNVGNLLVQEHPQFKMTRHIDHTYLLSNDHEIVLRHTDTGKTLQIHSSMPATQIYLANYFDGSLTNEHDKPILRNCGVAIEPQHIPNEINLWNKEIYDDNHPFHETITYTLTHI